jgi:Kef-type K+ transport system membrane component KefB
VDRYCEEASLLLPWWEPHAQVFAGLSLFAAAAAQPIANAATHTGAPDLLFILVAILVAARLFGHLAERVGQPAVLGEILAGVLLGGSVLGVLNPAQEGVQLFAELGVLILLFAIGLETDLGRLFRVGTTSAAVALVGVALPFTCGYLVALAFGLAALPSLVIAAALTATSVGITARVLADLGRLQDEESQIVIGAAVLDDVVGLVILAIVAQIVAGGAVSAPQIGATAIMAFGFLAVVLLIGRPVVPRVFEYFEKRGTPDTIKAASLVLAFLMAYLAYRSGSALIMGAFVAGVLLQPTRYVHDVEVGTRGLVRLFVPVFFVSVGASIDLTSLVQPSVLLLGGVLTAVGVLGKFAAGYAPFWYHGHKAVIGAGMIPRGEVGLIFAQMGLAAGVLTSGLFSAVTLMVMSTTLIAPLLLRVLLPGRRPPLARAPQGAGEVVGSGAATGVS